jgi:3-oxoacyl-[acyl-carrier protein] reductase
MPESHTRVLGPHRGLTTALAEGLNAAVGELDSTVPSGVDGVVIVVGADAAPEPAAVAAVGGEEWQRLTGDVMWRTLVALQHCHSSMRGRGGRILFALPTIGIAGAARLVPYTTALEGIRAMAKSAARQWRSEGIGVNMVAAPLRLFEPGLAPAEAHLTAAAFQDDSTLIHSLVETAKFLLRRDIDHIAGETVIADGGSMMLP